MDKESYIYGKFQSKFNGDDCAVVGEMAYCKDLFAQDVHFKREWFSMREIGAKALLVNISDMIVMNARPKYALLGISLPRDITKGEIDELCAGVNETAREWGVQIIGGDTISTDKICLSITLVGKCKAPVWRNSAHVGDIVAHTGELGSVLSELEFLQSGGEESTLGANSRFVRPRLRDKFFYKVAKYASAAMDISDGLGQDLERLLRASGVGMEWLRDVSEREMSSGEEYEILFSFAPKNLSKIYEIAEKTKTPIRIIGEIVQRTKQNSCEFHGHRHHFE